MPANATTKHQPEPKNPATTQQPQPETSPATNHQPQPARPATKQPPMPANATKNHQPRPENPATTHQPQPANTTTNHQPQLANTATNHRPQFEIPVTKRSLQPQNLATKHQPQRASPATNHQPNPENLATSHQPQPSISATIHQPKPPKLATSHQPQHTNVTSCPPVLTKHCKSGTVLIDLTEDLKTIYQAGNIPEANLWIPAFNLSEKDKADLISGEDLNDKHIHAAQKLLKNQFPYLDGLMDPVLVSTLNIPSPPTQEAVQLHNIPGHWLMSCSLGGSLTVYDSLNTTITSHVRKQLAHVYRPLATGPDDLIEVTIKRCQKQIGAHDCGLFAIANATALANGVDPATLKFQQAKMRKHLKLCLENKKLTMFPHRESDPTSHTKRRRKDTVSLHCFCHRYHPGSKTFKCSNCHNIFHLMCTYPRLNGRKRLSEITSKLQCSRCVPQQC